MIASFGKNNHRIHFMNEWTYCAIRPRRLIVANEEDQWEYSKSISRIQPTQLDDTKGRFVDTKLNLYKI